MNWLNFWLILCSHCNNINSFQLQMIIIFTLSSKRIEIIFYEEFFIEICNDSLLTTSRRQTKSIDYLQIWWSQKICAKILQKLNKFHNLLKGSYNSLKSKPSLSLPSVELGNARMLTRQYFPWMIPLERVSYSNLEHWSKFPRFWTLPLK